MGFAETYYHILSYFGIAFLGLAILVSICAVIPACYWLFSALSSNRGPAVFRRLLALVVVGFISYSYLGSPFFYGIAQWRRTTILCAFIIGLLLPILRSDGVRLEKRTDRGLAMLSGLWWAILVLSEALLVSGVPGQAVLLYLFMAVTGLLCGAVLGVTTARIAKQKMVEPATGAGGS